MSGTNATHLFVIFENASPINIRELDWENHINMLLGLANSSHLNEWWVSHLPRSYAWRKEISFQNAGFYWFKHPTNSFFTYDTAEVCYSIPSTNIERFTRKEFWNKLETPGPKIPFTAAKHCRRATAVTTDFGDAADFTDPYREGDDDNTGPPPG